MEDGSIVSLYETLKSGLKDIGYELKIKGAVFFIEIDGKVLVQDRSLDRIVGVCDVLHQVNDGTFVLGPDKKFRSTR